MPFDIYGEHKKTLAEPKRKIGETTFLIVHPSGNGGTAQLLWTVSNRSDRVYLDLLANVGEKKTPPGKRYSDLEVDVSFDKTGRCWTVVYRANNGTDAFVCSDTLLYAAPEEGYQKVLVVNGPPWPKYLYLRSRSPAIYSRLLLEHDAWQEPDSSGRFRILYKAWTNPYGERNLEYDNSVESFWCVKKALDEDAKKAIEAKRLPLKPDLPKLIKEDKERRVREDKERRIQEDKERRIQEQADRGKEK